MKLLGDTNMTDESEGVPYDPWGEAGYSTNKLRGAALTLREHAPIIATAPGLENAKKDLAFKNAVEALAVAAAHIDNLHGDMGPAIVNITSSGTDTRALLHGVDELGRVWKYTDAEGWQKIPNPRDD